MDHTAPDQPDRGMPIGRRFGVAVFTLAIVAVAGAAPLALRAAVRPANAAAAKTPVPPKELPPVDAAERNHRIVVTLDGTMAPPPTVVRDAGGGVTAYRPQAIHAPYVPAKPGVVKTPTGQTVSCHNSYDPACGEFAWTTPPGENQPISLHVSTYPAQPKVGEEVTVTVKASDPDARINFGWFNPGDGSKGSLTSGKTCRKPYGPWTTPEPAADEQTFTFRHVYEKAGKFKIWVDVASENAADAGNDCVDPYGSEASRTICIEVREATPEENGSPEASPSPYAAAVAPRSDH